MRRRWRSRRAGERGAAAVEFALILPLFMMLVMGTVDWGYYFFVDNVVTNAAREGARAGSVVDPTQPWATAQTAATTAVTNYLNRGGLRSASPTVITVTQDCVSPPSVCVDITYPVGTAGSITGFLQSIMPDNAVARAVMRWQ